MKWHVRQYVSIPFGELGTIAQKPAMVEGGLAGEPACLGAIRDLDEKSGSEV